MSQTDNVVQEKTAASSAARSGGGGDDELPQDKNHNNNNNHKLLPYTDSSHNSVTITIPPLDNDGDDDNDDETAAVMFRRDGFRDRFVETVEHFRSAGKTSVWVEVPMARAGVLEEIAASGLGFEFHHAEGTVAKLTRWLREDVPSKIPEYATHHVGVGAVVVHRQRDGGDGDDDRILCLRELRRNYHPWKIPTGLADLGESIEGAAEREVLEETGIRARCTDVLAFRHTHGMAHGRSDLFFLCALTPEPVDESGNVADPVPQACEIAEAKWIPLGEYRAMIDGETDESPNGHPVMSLVMREVFDQNISIGKQTVTSVVPGRRPTPLYFPTATTTTTDDNDNKNSNSDDNDTD